MIPQYVLACVGIDILVRMLECNLTDLKEWITKFLYMLLMYCVKTNNETEKDHCFLFNELTGF